MDNRQVIATKYNYFKTHLVSTLLAAVLLAHEWYPTECCSDHDCYKVPCSEIVLSGGNYHYKNLSWPQGTERSSPDGFCHVCVSPTLQKPLCIFLDSPNA